MTDTWIKHDGTDCPVPAGTRVKVLFRTFPWEKCEPHATAIYEDAISPRWDHYDLAGDIVAYQVLS